MRELRCKQYNPQMGNITITIRFLGKIIYMKFNSNTPTPQKNQIIKSLRDKGAKVEKADNWYRINMFVDQDEVIIANKRFDVTKLPPEKVEDILFEFFDEKYREARFVNEEIGI